RSAVVGATNVVIRGRVRGATVAAAYNSAAVVDSPDYLMRWRDRSALVRMRGNALLDLRYGVRPRAALDFFSSGDTKAPLFVFIHGGYWQPNDKKTFSFLPPGPL